MVIDTKSINIKTKQNMIFISIEYDLSMEKEHMSMSKIDIIIEPL